MVNKNKVEEGTDILNCLSNLSNDEVFTPPEIANKLLDLLPQELFKSKNTKFLDPCCKSGVFLREITRRLINGLKNQIPNLQKRVDWILSNQVFGIPLTELTYHMTKRTLYCSVHADGKYCITNVFKGKKSGNITPTIGRHNFVNDKCTLCGATKDIIKDRKEQYAYYFIHSKRREDIFKMNFDVIIGNPPYQFDTTGAQAQATPLYHKFIETAISLKPRYLSMIVPSRWFTGGFGLNEFRDKMAKDKRIRVLHDYLDASECFPGVEIKGGVNYFLWDRDHPGKCDFYTHKGNSILHNNRYLEAEFLPGLVIRDSRSISVVEKILKKTCKRFTDIVGPQTPFGISTNDARMHKEKKNNDVKIYALKKELFIEKKCIEKNSELINKWKLITPKAVGSGDTVTDRIKPIISEPGSCCSGTYIFIGPFQSKSETENAKTYIETKFFHFLVGQLKNTQDCLFKVFSLVPLVKFNTSYNDEKLYKMFDLSKEERDFIESSVWNTK